MQNRWLILPVSYGTLAVVPLHECRFKFGAIYVTARGPTVPAGPEKARRIADFTSKIIYVNFTGIWTQPQDSPLRGFVINKVTLVQDFLRALRFSPVSNIPPLLQVHINSSVFMFLLSTSYAPGIEQCLLLILRRRNRSTHKPHLIERDTQTNPDMAPLFAQRILWQFIDGGGKPKYGVAWNFCAQTSMGAKWGWRIIGVWL
jgi:hypothetical protein